MGATVHFEQSPGQVDDPGLSVSFKERHQEILKADVTALTTAQRLTRRALKDVLKIPFEDDLGEFFIEVRMPTQAELDKIMKTQAELNKANKAEGGDATRALELTKDLQELVADLCQDESITPEFFQSGDFQVCDFGQIIKEVMLETEKRAVDSRSFRQDRQGSGPV
jgi:hypothetical protein